MEDAKIRITWYGTASVRIAAGSSQILIDPFFPFPDSKIKVSPDAFADCSRILISHGHFDHISSIPAIVRPGTAIFCTKTPYQSLCRMGVSRKNLRMICPGDGFSAGAFRITVLHGKHIRFSAWDILKALCSRRTVKYRKGIFAKLRVIASCLEKRESLCYLVEVGGRQILILGSLGLFPDTAYPKHADLVLFPYQGSRKLCAVASGIYRQLKPKAVLLTHFDDTFPPFSAEIDTSDIEQYLQNRAAVHKLQHGGTLELSPAVLPTSNEKSGGRS